MEIKAQYKFLTLYFKKGFIYNYIMCRKCILKLEFTYCELYFLFHIHANFLLFFKHVFITFVQSRP